VGPGDDADRKRVSGPGGWARLNERDLNLVERNLTFLIVGRYGYRYRCLISKTNIRYGYRFLAKVLKHVFSRIALLV
jgi:hypothetical protein